MQIHKSNANSRITNILSVIGGILILDRFLKMLVVVKMKAIEIIPGFFQLVFYQNTKGPFSLPIPLWLTIAVSTLIIIILLILIFLPPPKSSPSQREGEARWGRAKIRLPLAIITAGALSNLFDRIFYGYAIDTFNFLNFSFFNLADGLIIFGIFFLIFNLFKKRTD